jgi:transposase
MAKDLTDEQWNVLKPLLPVPPKRADGRGRPPTDPRAVLNGILWILRTGAQWNELPETYPPKSTCHRWFQRWSRDGTFGKILRALARDLEERGEICIEESFIDGTFVPAKKGGLAWETPSGARARRSWPLQTALVFLSPVARQALRRTK